VPSIKKGNTATTHAAQHKATGDAPRLWMPAARWPGCAFTRSLGDASAEAIGVTGAPEVTTLRLTPHAAFLLVASDGVWEFVSSQAAVDVAAAALAAAPDGGGTPAAAAGAASALVAAARAAWLRHDTRVDDVTVIVVLLQARSCTRTGFPCWLTSLK
jgi:serine/threonine protein phosphatase PrpC